jgi:hypothetical protein
MSLRIRDILIRDADGAVVAGAPKAEVAVSTTGLLMGSLHAKRVSLVGAEPCRPHRNRRTGHHLDRRRAPADRGHARDREARDGGDAGAAKRRSFRRRRPRPRSRARTSSPR